MTIFLSIHHLSDTGGAGNSFLAPPPPNCGLERVGRADIITLDSAPAELHLRPSQPPSPPTQGSPSPFRFVPP